MPPLCIVNVTVYITNSLECVKPWHALINEWKKLSSTLYIYKELLQKWSLFHIFILQIHNRCDRGLWSGKDKTKVVHSLENKVYTFSPSNCFTIFSCLLNNISSYFKRADSKYMWLKILNQPTKKYLFTNKGQRFQLPIYISNYENPKQETLSCWMLCILCCTVLNIDT